MTDDGGGADPDADASLGPAPADDSMDELDATQPADDGGDAGSFAFTASPVGRVASRVFASSAPDAGPGPYASTGSTATAPGSVFSNPDLERARAELRDRLDRWQPPAGSDPEAAADMKADLDQLLDNFHTYPGQDIDSAIATLKYEFEDRVHDFAQDQKLDALMDAAAADEAAANALADEMDAARAALQQRVDEWQAPDGADPAAVASLKADLAGMVDRFTAIPGQTSDDAIADLKARFNDRVRDFAQDEKLDAVVDELAVPDAPTDPTMETDSDEQPGQTPDEDEQPSGQTPGDDESSEEPPDDDRDEFRLPERLREELEREGEDRNEPERINAPNMDVDDRVATPRAAIHDVFDDEMEPAIGVKTAPAPGARDVATDDAVATAPAATASASDMGDDLVGDIDAGRFAAAEARAVDVAAAPDDGTVTPAMVVADALGDERSPEDMSTESGTADLRERFEDHLDDADAAFQTVTDDDDDGYLADPNASMPEPPDDADDDPSFL
jgi:hypothetical protein